MKPLITTLCFASLACAASAAAPQSRPNILYIMADDMGYADVSCFGRREYATTNIDKLAAGGAKIALYQADVADIKSFARAIDDVARRMPPLRGVIHAAGFLRQHNAFAFLLV